MNLALVGIFARARLRQSTLRPWQFPMTVQNAHGHDSPVRGENMSQSNPLPLLSDQWLDVALSNYRTVFLWTPCMPQTPLDEEIKWHRCTLHPVDGCMPTQ